MHLLERPAERVHLVLVGEVLIQMLLHAAAVQGPHGGEVAEPGLASGWQVRGQGPQTVRLHDLPQLLSREGSIARCTPRKVSVVIQEVLHGISKM